MSYLAIARKWRPRRFADVVGQDHIVRALQNALARDQVHHAYLLAGTRGVGKTTIARLLAKVLNCDAPEAGEPCGSCSACISIDEGRFVDLIEVDAASRTKVEQTRELLDNVQYTPSAGRYKVYLIDEVHMLSASSFNALLKTLEEPPPHVKFLLATTDPDRLPATILSRCLQFTLKRLPVTLIAERLAHICSTEGIEFESGSLMLLARAGDGSMRDSLSLLDQAVSFGDGKLLAADVAALIGTLDRRQIGALLNCIVGGDARALMALVRDMHGLVPDYAAVLEDLAMQLQQLAVLQMAGPEVLDEDSDVELLTGLAARTDPELVQLWYQIAIGGCHDLDLAPQARAGFEMTLLRMLAFRPALPATGAADDSDTGGHSVGGAQTRASDVSPAPSASTLPAGGAAASASLGAIGDWNALVARLPLRGASLQLAKSCVPLVGATGASGALTLRIESGHQYLLLAAQQAQLREALSDYFGHELQLQFEVVSDPVDTPNRRQQNAVSQRLDKARKSIESDPVVQQLIDTFEARLDPDSVRPVDRGSKH